MALNIVLVEPEIPNNTGNIGRLSLASRTRLHLVKPFGFTIDDKRVKRAGLDYWKHVDLYIYEDINEFLNQHNDKKFALLSSSGSQSYLDIPYEDELFLIFGKESSGLPQSIINQYNDSCYKIPIFSPHVRSLNLANAVSVVVYEGKRQLIRLAST